MSRLGREGVLRDYLLQVARLPRISPRQREALAAEAAAGDPLALRALAQCLLPLVLALAARRRGEGLRFDRLLAVGNQALLRALAEGCTDEAPMVERLQAAWDGAVAAAEKAGRRRA